MSGPDVSVVITSGGDGAATDSAATDRTRASLARQTLRGLEVVEATDRRAGLERASALWVVFADPGTVFERHACKNLLRAAELEGADVVVGGPQGDAIGDARLADRLIRRSLLTDDVITVGDGVRHGDALIALRVEAVAPVVVTVPEVILLARAERPTDAADDVALAVALAAFLDARGRAPQRRALDERFLRHDVRARLGDLAFMDDEAARRVMATLARHVATLDPDIVRGLPSALRVAIRALLADDLGCLRAAVAFLDAGAVVGARILGHGGREWWDCPHDPGEPGRDPLLDVTDLHLLAVPFSQRRYRHVLETLEVAGASLTVRGTTVDYDDVIDDATGIEVRVMTDDGATAMRLPARWTGRDGVERRWTATGRPASTLDRRLTSADAGTVAVALTRGALVNVTPARATSTIDAQVRFTGQARSTGPDTVSVHGAAASGLRWSTTRAAAWRGWAETVVRAWRRLPGASPLAASWDVFWRHGLPERVGRLLRPRDLVVFESDSGRTATGNARAISEYLHAHHPGIAQAWSYRSRNDRVPDFAEPVERQGTRHHWRANRARFWVDDGLTSLWIRKPPRTRAVLSGSGVPVHRLGLDDPSVLVRGPAMRNLVRRYGRYDLLVAPSRYGADLVAAALAFGGTSVAAGIPRMDRAIALRAEGRGALDALRRGLDLPLDRTIVVYAPTLRQPGAEPVVPVLDLRRWARDLGDRAYLLVRAHPLERFAVPDDLRFAVRDISDVDDLASFVAAAQLVVSDYSSLIGDAALLDLPVVLYQPDREAFVNRTRGLYPGAGAAGPTVSTMDALVREVDLLIADPIGWERQHAAERRTFAADRCGPADGRASERAVAAMLSLGGQ